eukprot:Skav222347  [mRNA]  locus=scaffold3497:137369:138881:- [translate_table: standard]
MPAMPLRTGALPKFMRSNLNVNKGNHMQGNFACSLRCSTVRFALPPSSTSTLASLREPSWHRRLRAKRSRLRGYLRRASRLDIGKRRRATVLSAIAFLRRHHTWNVDELPSPLRPLAKISTMSWHCKDCDKANPINSETCRHCHKPWQSVWKQGKRAASRNRPRSKPKQRQPKQAQKDQPGQPSAAEPWHVFPQKVPWVPSTPQGRLPQREKDQDADPEALPLPSAPILPAPPALQQQPEPLTEAESKTLLHLKALKDLGALPDSLSQHLGVLEEKQQNQAATRALTHGHLNRLHRAKNNVSTQLKRVQDADTEWRQFMATVNQNVQEHAVQFQKYRTELVEVYHKRLREWEEIKSEVTSASQTLVGQPPAAELVEEAPQVQADIEQFQQRAMMIGTLQEEVEPIESSGEEMELEQEDGKEPKRKVGIKAQPKPFARTAGSPNKVAQTQLKTKTGPNKENSKAEKGDKKDEEL